MSHENSMQINQREMASEYGRYVETKSNNRIIGIIVKALIIPLIALLLIVAGAAFGIANYSPNTYTQAKDIIFEKVDFEKLTGLPNSTSKEYLDSWLILNSEQQPVEEKAQQETLQEDKIESAIK